MWALVITRRINRPVQDGEGEGEGKRKPIPECCGEVGINSWMTKVTEANSGWITEAETNSEWGDENGNQFRSTIENVLEMRCQYRCSTDGRQRTLIQPMNRVEKRKCLSYAPSANATHWVTLLG